MKQNSFVYSLVAPRHGELHRAAHNLFKSYLSPHILGKHTADEDYTEQIFIQMWKEFVLHVYKPRAYSLGSGRSVVYLG